MLTIRYKVAIVKNCEMENKSFKSYVAITRNKVTISLYIYVYIYILFTLALIENSFVNREKKLQLQKMLR